MNKIIGDEYQRLLTRKAEIEKSLGKEYDEKAKQFLKDGLCHVCGKPVIEPHSVWCHRYDCQLGGDGMCSCGLSVHPECCSVDTCFNFVACPDNKSAL